MKEIKSISFIGSGNVATQLALEFFSKGIQIDCILSRTLENAEELGNKVNAAVINDTSKLPTSSDLYIIALKDDVIEPYLEELTLKDKIIVHTSGSFTTNKLDFISKINGCFYPLQTFSKEASVDFKDIPIFIESTDSNTRSLLLNLANKISNNVQQLSAKQKKALHISAIGINNFTHFILAKSKEYCLHNDLDFNSLKPLLKQTVDSIISNPTPINKQTGPARRGDIDVINDHINLLSDNKQYQAIYKDLSQYILNEFHGEKYKL